MTPNLFTSKNVIVQGITGAHGMFHTKTMLEAGTTIVAGTSPNKAGQTVHGIPVFDSIKSIKKEFVVDVSIIFVPAKFATGAIFEAIDNSVPLIVCITEGIPVHDMLRIKQHLAGKRSTLIGPNCPGVLLPEINKFGIIPANFGVAGSVGIVSRSGTLTYEAMAGLTQKGIGQKYVIGIGGDQIRGTGFSECLELFEHDPEVTHIVMIGEIGGDDEQQAANHIKSSITKPVFGYIAGHTAPIGVQLGHAGAILGNDSESAASKTAAMKDVGVHTFPTITSLIAGVAAAAPTNK